MFLEIYPHNEMQSMYSQPCLSIKYNPYKIKHSKQKDY